MVAEDEVADRANRLLLAAATGSAFQAPSPEERLLIEEATALRQSVPADGFARLAPSEPALTELANAVNNAASDTPDGGWASDRDAQRALWDRFGPTITALVGEQAHSDDPLLRTRSAYVTVLNHLEDTFGVPRP
jgi:hypothetical protein